MVVTSMLSFAKILTYGWKARSVGILGLSAIPEMRLTVSFCITYTLRPVWGVGATPGIGRFFRSTANLATVIIHEHFAATLRLTELPRRD
jgi:hypothetical protein